MACRVYFSSRDQRGLRFANARSQATNKPPENGRGIGRVVFDRLVNRHGDDPNPLGSKRGGRSSMRGKVVALRSARAQKRER
jgi:hypothetical protein